MSEAYKLKSEVLKILRDNILKGLEAFGLPISSQPGDGGWQCMESDQPSFRNLDKLVTVYLEQSERIGWQGDARKFNEETGKIDVFDNFIEQQHWRIKILYRSTTEPIEDGSTAFSVTDIAGMLIAWFNRLGCLEFRKHNMGNLFIKQRDLKTYKDPSDASQWTAEFVLKLQVPKTFATEIETTTAEYVGVVGLNGRPRAVKDVLM